MKPMHVEVPPAATADGKATRTAVVDGRARVRLSVPEAHASLTTDTADPFVVLLLHFFMEAGRPVRIAGRVSPALLRGAEEYMAAFAAWFPDRYRVVPIEAEDERDPPAPAAGDAALVAFSGGVDSCFTAWRHARGQVGRRRAPLAAGLFIHGLDMPLSPAVFDRALAGNRRMLESLGLDTLVVETDFRELPIHVYDASGAAAVACLLLFQARFGTALLASSAAYANLMVPAPTSPITDHLLATPAMRIVHDGAEARRPEKVGAILDWPEARRWLRVCWAGPDPPRNCCRCDKCIRTILNFRVMGGGLPECFAEDVTDDRIRRVRLDSTASVRGFENILALAEARGVRGRWVGEVRGALRRARFRARRRRLRAAWRRLRRV